MTPLAAEIHRDEQAALETIAPDELVRVTCDLIRGRGENPGGVEADTVRRLLAHCERIGAVVTLHEVSADRANLYATMGDPEGPAILFLGHSDVVPAGEGWTGDPFEPRIAEGAIIGRGSTDMKGGIAAVLSAMQAISTVRPDLRLEFVCTVDEEDLALGVLEYVRQTPPREYLACIVAEPTNLDVVIGCRGATNLVVSVTGESAHAGRPEDGASAILAAAEVIAAIRHEHDTADRTADPLLGGPSWSIGTIVGGSGTSIVAQSCEISIDRRTMPGEDSHDILAQLLDSSRERIGRSTFSGAERIRLEGSVAMVMPGFRTMNDAALVETASGALRDLGHDGTPTGWTAACEGGFIARHHGVPTIILGPGDINNQAHQPDERVLIADLESAARAYVLIALRLSAHASAQHSLSTQVPFPHPANGGPERNE